MSEQQQPTTTTPPATPYLLTEETVRTILSTSDTLSPITYVAVCDISAGCGTSFALTVVTPAFEGIRVLQRHRMVHTALGDIMKDVHAVQLKCYTPTAYAAVAKGNSS